MGEYISKDALMKAFVIRVVHGTSVPEWNDAIDIAESIPAADVVEVVRCADCVHYNDKMEMYCDVVCTIRHYCDSSPIIVGKDDFCSSGKRKDGGQET